MRKEQVIVLQPSNADIKWVDHIQVAKRDNPTVVYINFKALVPGGDHSYEGDVARVVMPEDTVRQFIKMLQHVVDDKDEA